MSQWYEVWVYPGGNIVDDFTTLDEAVTFLKDWQAIQNEGVSLIDYVGLLQTGDDGSASRAWEGDDLKALVEA